MLFDFLYVKCLEWTTCRDRLVVGWEEGRVESGHWSFMVVTQLCEWPDIPNQTRKYHKIHLWPILRIGFRTFSCWANTLPLGSTKVPSVFSVLGLQLCMSWVPISSMKINKPTYLPWSITKLYCFCLLVLDISSSLRRLISKSIKGEKILCWPWMTGVLWCFGYMTFLCYPCPEACGTEGREKARQRELKSVK